ncbi:Panacea domain-containing protein [Flagellimonas meridianipacifica]|uniref:Putative phage-associated protein n=1 Tax=Flagellimonas meridianipacifica TaxID=1080225 RepID=A0A2T0MGI8_9FLAO|nr:type II toxin-antitoxin system antitoxin SocA domain-containing protein [Allomuricauda pacifica]PRX56675.1 putative phage-associated protein [Allomuricauda pacifica]
MKTIPIDKLVDVIILYCNSNGLTITPLKLQKILYYIQAWHIARFEKHTLFDELPEAWVNGPVYRSVYNTFSEKFYRNTPLKINVQGDVPEELETQMNELDLDQLQTEHINTTIKFYSPQSEGNLVLKTHADAPWNIARDGLDAFERSSNEISIDSMFDYYNPLLA